MAARCLQPAPPPFQLRHAQPRRARTPISGGQRNGSRRLENDVNGNGQP